MSDPVTETASPSPPPLAPPPAPRGSSRNLKIALAASVALNLGVVGLGLGRAFHDWHGGPGEMVRSIGFGPFTDALGPDESAALRDQFVARMPDFRAERQKMQADTSAILAALRADPFDPAVLDGAMGAMEDHIAQRMGLGRSLMQDFIKALSPQARLDFADRLEASLRHGPGDKN